MASIRESIVIGSPPEKVHAYLARVETWATWFSELGEITDVEGDGSPGTVVRRRYSVAGKDVDTVTTVKENGAKAAGGYSWRAERTGALPGWQTFDFNPQDGKTVVASELEYEMPGGIFGKAADHLGVKAALEHSLRRTLENLKELSEEDWVVGLTEKEEGEWPPPCES